MATEDLQAPRHKPSVSQLGVDLATLDWQRSGAGSGSFEVAFVGGGPGEDDAIAAQWVLLRVADDPADRVLVYDRTEWECFLDGVRGGEFDPGRGAGTHPDPGQPDGLSRRRSARAARRGQVGGGCRQRSALASHYFSN